LVCEEAKKTSRKGAKTQRKLTTEGRANTQPAVGVVTNRTTPVKWSVTTPTTGSDFTSGIASEATQSPNIRLGIDVIASEAKRSSRFYLKCRHTIQQKCNLATSMHNQNRVDHIITGLGLAGAALALHLIARGKTIAVFDEPSINRASRVAAGLFNPISGKLMVKTWRADDLFPYLIDFYRNAEQITSQKFFQPQNIYTPFRSIEEQNNWISRGDEAAIKPFIKRIMTSSSFDKQVKDELGGVLLDKSGYLQVGTYLDAVRELLRSKNYLFGKMHHDRLRLDSDTVRYEDVVADSIVFCEGLHARNNPITNWLPVSPLKGETIDVRFSQELGAIYNRGAYAVPLGDLTYRIGATFDRSVEPGITAQGREDLEQKLRSLIRLPYDVIGQNWGFRPTTRDRRPMVGAHPEFRNVFIFNGMGTKGVSQAPYFSRVLADYLEGEVSIGPEVNISRFYALSSKSRD